MRYLLLITLILFSLAGFSAVYMHMDKNGNITYSDTPDNDAKPVNIPANGNNISLPSPTPAPTGTSSPSLATTPTTSGLKQAYNTFSITSPTAQQTFQNQRDIPVELNIQPPLQEGDNIQLFLDGNPLGQPIADISQLVIHDVERGEHQVSATLMDKAGRMLKKTGAVTIFIHYSAIPTGSGAVKN